MFGLVYWHSQYTPNRWALFNPHLICCLVGCITITSQICSFPNTPGPVIAIPPIQRRLENPYPFLIFVSFFCPHRFLLLLSSALQIYPHFFCFHNKSSTLSSSEADFREKAAELEDFSLTSIISTDAGQELFGARAENPNQEVL
ncbi:uncharacterized protein LOC105782654 [Gossypium raimondii]|uniref:uncharacterized protein LOC105782654 n=1 Tax=Gossypium raimondii TaxID=29730 RepID=UPI00227B43D7|nr:uncharacterized protein LOC105782654 [Gossypium raimondii]